MRGRSSLSEYGNWLSHGRSGHRRQNQLSAWRVRPRHTRRTTKLPPEQPGRAQPGSRSGRQRPPGHDPGPYWVSLFRPRQRPWLRNTGGLRAQTLSWSLVLPLEEFMKWVLLVIPARLRGEGVVQGGYREVQSVEDKKMRGWQR